MTHHRPKPRTPLPNADRSSPALRALADAGFTVREAARMVCRSERSLLRQLRRNQVTSHFVASTLAALCETSIWIFSTRALAPEHQPEHREEPR